MLETLDFDKIDKNDIDALVTKAVPESRLLDYKAALPGGTDADKKEFAADVTSFANAGGGTIVFGVAEQGGVAVDACGLEIKDADKEVLRLQDLMMTGIDPRIAGVQVRWVSGFRLGPVILVRVPRSWSAPHMVTAGRAESRFFARSGARKEPLDVRQIRAAFALSQDLPDRIRRFRDERLGRIIGDETPVRLGARERLVVHLIPLASMDPGNAVDVTQAVSNEGVRGRLGPIGASGWSYRYNIDGFVTFSGDREKMVESGYVQVFRRGIIEAVDSLVAEPIEGAPAIASGAFPRDLVAGVGNYLSALEMLKVDPPLLLLVSMIGMKGVTLYVGPSSRSSRRVVPIDRDVLLLPEVMFDKYVVSSFLGLDGDRLDLRLRPVLDAVWQASGLPEYVDERRR